MTQLALILETIQKIKPEIVSKYHIKTIGIFGSAVHEDFDADEDTIEIIIEFNKPIGLELMDLSDFLAQHINKKVDVIAKNGMDKKYYREIKSEIVFI